MQKDNVNHPTHYEGKVECIEALESATIGLEGIEAVDTANAIKYLWRWKKKNGVEDLKKAVWYIQHLIGVLEKSSLQHRNNNTDPHHYAKHPNCKCSISPIFSDKNCGVMGVEVSVPHGASMEEVMEAVLTHIEEMEGMADADN